MSDVTEARREETEALARSSTRERPLRMLVVEDDPDLAVLVVRVAFSIDSESCVDWAGSSDAAEERLMESEYDLVLADYVVDGSSAGLALLPVVRDTRSRAAFALMSAMPLRLPEKLGCPFLPKPFSAAVLRRFLLELLD